MRPAPLSLAALGVLVLTGAPAFSATPAQPPTEEWPPIEPAPQVANGFHPGGWEEFQWRDGAWEPTQRRTVETRDSGRVVVERHESWFQDTWQVSRVDTLTFDEAGRLHEKLRQEAVGVNLQDRGRHTYAYPDDGAIHETLEVRTPDGRWQPLGLDVYQFDGDGRLVQHTASRRHGNLTRGVTLARTHYDEAGRRKQLLRQRDQGGRWVDGERIDFGYTKAGQLERIALFVVGKGGPDWMEGVRITRELDENGRPKITHRHTRGPADGLEISSRYTHAYDEHGNERERVFQQLRDGIWVDARKEVYTPRAQP